MNLLNLFKKKSENHPIFRIGNGYDIHRLKDGNGIILGGVYIECNKEIIAHSDGDVVIHSLVDSLLGSLALRDIGYHFSSKNSKFKNFRSLFFLKKIRSFIKKKQYSISNIDITIVLEKPLLYNYIPSMIENISKHLFLEENKISIKSTTNDKVGSIGKNKAIAVFSVSSLQKM